MAHTILIADDESEIVELLKLYMEKEGYTVVAAFSGKEALEAVNRTNIDLVVMDIMMSVMNGLQALKELRLTYNIPVILLSARVQDHDKILGLGMGADDYITKPFNPLEVVARVQAQLRRFYHLNRAQESMSPSDKITIGELTLDRISCQVSKNDQTISLTSIEYKLLQHFMEHPNRVFTKRQLYETVWGDYYTSDDNTVMVCISKLRDKIESDPILPYLVTIRGLGYKFTKRV
jgi:DNA-binding response OmpR family regulator